MTHQLAHAACGLGLYRAGEATTYHRRAAWLTVAAVGFVAAHRHYHRRSHP